MIMDPHLRDDFSNGSRPQDPAHLQGHGNVNGTAPLTFILKPYGDPEEVPDTSGTDTGQFMIRPTSNARRMKVGPTNDPAGSRNPIYHEGIARIVIYQKIEYKFNKYKRSDVHRYIYVYDPPPESGLGQLLLPEDEVERCIKPSPKYSRSASFRDNSGAEWTQNSRRFNLEDDLPQWYYELKSKRRDLRNRTVSESQLQDNTLWTRL
ncbi:uncharacterized protein DFL_007024 [Arthrobotrys flagrans]|uniref:Uncharacterized protein n=1 Tax=Arthrobotrys flagrans TaxID=97331 RepID=A0A436ZUV3_ARTFL|nr:hypothetical protein DFL_007024 [Arthrobotrys flagrans]